MTPRVLMCPPDYFQVLYEINPWMNVRRPVDPSLAMRQWRAYYDLLSSLGVKIELIAPVKGLPDMVFTANAGLVLGKLVVRSNFRHPERAKEEPHYDQWFRKNGWTLKTLDKPLYFEGEGDALLMGGDLYAGYHFRSDLESHDALAGILKIPYFALELNDKRFYHLDTCFAPLNAHSALIYQEAFELYAQLTLLENVEDPVLVPEAEALKFACNAFIMPGHAVLPLGCAVTRQALERRGYQVYELDFSEFIKAGGAAKCLTLWLEKEAPQEIPAASLND